MPPTPEKFDKKWHHPLEVMKLQKLRIKKKALQARINGSLPNHTATPVEKKPCSFDELFAAKKRKNPFLKENVNESNVKRPKPEPYVLDESTDQTLFKLLQQSVPSSSRNASLTSFNNILSKIETEQKQQQVEIVKAKGESWLPIDWALKHKVRLLSVKPFPWNQMLKLSEEASAITAFTRCLGTNTETTLDTSSNAKFHQCCLYWQHPNLPWLNLFPRGSARTQVSQDNFVLNAAMKKSLKSAWCDSLRSLYQLIRTRQCPYFYVCANTFTVLFRAGGICGFTDNHAMITPTTRGLRATLTQEEISFTMPLMKKRVSDLGYETDSTAGGQLDEPKEESVEDEEIHDEKWLKGLGVNEEDMKQIKYTQQRIDRQAESEIDNSEQSLIVIQGMDMHALYNFLLNCKSVTAFTGPLAGIPATLLAPVAFHGASLNSLKVRDNKVNLEGADYYSLELSGPILPTTIHNLFAINPPEHSLTMTFNGVVSTDAFSKVRSKERKSDIDSKGTVVFGKENLSDCGLLPKVLKHFCAAEEKFVTNVECLKYTSDNKTYTWS